MPLCVNTALTSWITKWWVWHDNISSLPLDQKNWLTLRPIQKDSTVRTDRERIRNNSFNWDSFWIQNKSPALFMHFWNKQHSPWIGVRAWGEAWSPITKQPHITETSITHVASWPLHQITYLLSTQMNVPCMVSETQYCRFFHVKPRWRESGTTAEHLFIPTF